MRTSLGMTHVTRKEKNKRILTAHIHVSKNSTDQDLPESRLPGSHLVDNNLVSTTRDAHFAEVRCATRGTGCLRLPPCEDPSRRTLQPRSPKPTKVRSSRGIGASCQHNRMSVPAFRTSLASPTNPQNQTLLESEFQCLSV